MMEINLFVELWRKFFHVRQSHQLQDAGGGGQLLQSRLLQKTKTPRTARQFTLVAQHRVEEVIAQFALQPGAEVFVFDNGSGTLNDASVLHAGWAGALAAAAIEAAVNVSNKRFGYRQLAAIHLQDLIDAAARRIHLHTENAIGGAGVQTQATLDASGVKLPGWAVGRNGLGRRGHFFWPRSSRLQGELIFIFVETIS